MLPKSTERVPKQTANKVNEKIRQETIKNITRRIGSGPEEIGREIGRLEREWDTERALQVIPASFVLAGIGLAAWLNKKWLIFPAVVAGFLLEHGLQGWCPPLPLLRRLGLRTPHEIQQERYALKAVRGDFREAAELKGILKAVELE